MAQEAVGAIFMSMETGRVMLNLRSENVTYSNYWGFIGGKVEAGETPEQALTREIHEEIGDNIPELRDIELFDKFKTPNGRFTYHSYLVFVSTEFVPELNDESSGYAWVKLGNWPKPLHPGAKSTLYNDELLESFEKMWELKTAPLSSTKQLIRA